MKKMLLMASAFAVVATGLFAQDTTWTNPIDEKTDMVPHSMLNAVTNGTMYDAVDVIITSPAELSEFPGIELYTAYGNYESWANFPKDDSTGPVTVINPFTTNDLSGTYDAGSTSDVNVAFQLGYIMPVFGFQSGIVGGFQFGSTNGLTGYNAVTDSDGTTLPANAGNVTFTTNNVEDTNNDGSAGYTNNESFDFTEKTVDNHFRIGAGTDLDFLGVSVMFNSNSSSIVRGGTYDYSLSVGPDTVDYDPANTGVTTSKSIRYGYKDGDPRFNGVLNNDWDIEMTGQLPLTLFDISMPVTASVRFGGSSDGTSAYGVPQTTTITDTYVSTNGAGGTVDDVSTLTVTEGITSLDYANTNGAFVGVAGPVANQTAVAVAVNLADDPDEMRDGDFNFGISGRIDPKIVINNVLTARTRAAANFDMNIGKDDNYSIYEYELSRADSGATNSREYYKQTVEDPNSLIETDMSFELGGILEAKTASGRLTVSTGLFYNPVFDLQTTKNDDEVTVDTHTVVDQTGAAAEITAANAWGDLALGTWQGTMTRTQTVSYTGPDKENVVNHNFIIPVTAKVDLVKDKFSIIGGYNLVSTITSTYKEDGLVNATVTDLTYTNTSGTDVSPATGTASVDETVSSITSKEVSRAVWAGYMNFMLRWMPIENLKVDFFGQSVMTAFDFDLFGDDGAGTDFNPNNIIDNLGMSVTFSF